MAAISAGSNRTSTATCSTCSARRARTASLSGRQPARLSRERAIHLADPRRHLRVIGALTHDSLDPEIAGALSGWPVREKSWDAARGVRHHRLHNRPPHTGRWAESMTLRWARRCGRCRHTRCGAGRVCPPPVRAYPAGVRRPVARHRGRLPAPGESRRCRACCRSWPVRAFQPKRRREAASPRSHAVIGALLRATSGSSDPGG